MAFTRCVLKPLPEKGTQKKRTLKRNARGQHAGRTPEEKEVIRPLVVPGRGGEMGGTS